MPVKTKTEKKEEILGPIPDPILDVPEEKEDVLGVFSAERKDTKKYFEAIGRRKRSVARVRIFTANPKESAAQGGFSVNEKTFKDYFRLPNLIETAMESLSKLKAADHFRISVKLEGGGINSQAEAVRLGIARALIKFDQNFRKKLKKSGLLSRDPREKERRKYGLKKARRAPQFSKR